jgi:hypothetical protein
VTEPYRIPENYHTHRCKFCAFVWEHHDINDAKHADYGAHECPACHRCNWSLGIYDGLEIPKVRNGRAAPQEYGAHPIHPDQDHPSEVSL